MDLRPPPGSNYVRGRMPVYSGNGMAGRIDLVREGMFTSSENVVFRHTGGSVAQFGYR